MKLVCRTCKEEVDEIVKYSTKCRSCTSTDAHYRHLKATFGLTKHEYDDKFSAQKGKCAICQCENKADSKGNNLSVDHWHDPLNTKRRGTLNKSHIRGLLCHDCNIGLGAFKENIEVLSRAIEYLKSYKSVN